MGLLLLPTFWTISTFCLFQTPKSAYFLQKLLELLQLLEFSVFSYLSANPNSSQNEKKTPKVEDFDQIRLFVYFGTKSSTFGAFFLKILHFWLRKLEKPPLWEFFFFFLLDFLSKLEKPPLLVVFFSKVRISFRIPM